jgi:urease subunit gamma/beta
VSQQSRLTAYDCRVRLTPWEQDRLLVFAAAELARRHRAAGLLLNAPEAVALISDAMFEVARAGESYERVVEAGRTAVAPTEVMDGVAALVDEIRLEVLLEDGTRLVVLDHPLGQDPDASSAEGPPPAPAERETLELNVVNRSARPVRVSSHYPFEQVNRRLEFDRARAAGFRLDLPAGAVERWAPGEQRKVRLVRYGGTAGSGQ